MERNDLGDRMKRYEAVTRRVLPRRCYTLVRVDGKSFHSYCRGLERPYDAEFMADMDAVAEALCKEMSGAVCAFTQSDEISVLLCDFNAAGTEPWMGGIEAKITSISAAVATATLNARRPEGGRALFDSRVFSLADPTEVINYFIWRQRDTVKNSISMAAQAVFPHKELQGLHGGALQEKLWAEKNINWNDYPVGFRRGRLTTRVVAPEPVSYTDRRTGELVETTAMRSRWVTEGAARFVLAANNPLVELVPVLGLSLSPNQDRPAASS